MVGFPGFTDPGLIHMTEDAGLAVVAMTLMPRLRVKSWESDQPSLGEQRAEIEMRVGFYHSNYGIAKRWAEVAEDSRVDGFIWNYLFSCRPIASTSHLLKKVVEDETGILVLSLGIAHHLTNTRPVILFYEPDFEQAVSELSTGYLLKTPGYFSAVGQQLSFLRFPAGESARKGRASQWRRPIYDHPYGGYSRETSGSRFNPSQLHRL